MKEDQENKKDGNIQAKFAQWLSPFQIAFVIFWVVCNYDFLLILIGKKAILHELYAHFGYGCGKNSINLFGYCTKKSSMAYSWYFLIWKFAIPFVLTVGYIKYYYLKLVTPLNLEYEKIGKDVLRQMVNEEVRKKVDQVVWKMEADIKMAEVMPNYNDDGDYDYDEVDIMERVMERRRLTLENQKEIAESLRRRYSLKTLDK